MVYHRYTKTKVKHPCFFFEMTNDTTSIVQSSVPDVAPTCVSSLQLDVRCPVVIAAAIPDAMLLPTDECFAQEVPEPVYNGLTCPKYAL